MTVMTRYRVLEEPDAGVPLQIDELFFAKQWEPGETFTAPRGPIEEISDAERIALGLPVGVLALVHDRTESVSLHAGDWLLWLNGDAFAIVTDAVWQTLMIETVDTTDYAAEVTANAEAFNAAAEAARSSSEV